VLGEEQNSCLLDLLSSPGVGATIGSIGLGHSLVVGLLGLFMILYLLTKEFNGNALTI